MKAEIYAAAGIAEYWLVLPERRQLERFRTPKAGAYSSTTEISFEDTLDILDGWIDLSVL